MFKSVVVALDLEENTDRALRVAVPLAEKAGLPIELLTVTPPSVGKIVAMAELDLLASRLGLDPYTRVILRSTDAARAITEHVRDRDNALLVMATKAKGPIGEHLLGSVSEDVLAQLHGPVLLIGPNVSPDSRLERPTLIMAVDGSHDNEAAVGVLNSWLETFGGDRPRIVEVSRRTAEHGRDGAHPSAAQRIADGLSAHGVKVEFDVLEGHDPAAVLEEYSSLVHDPVVVATSTRWTDTHPHWRSITRRIVHGSSRPVLVVPARSSVSSRNDELAGIPAC